MVIALLTFNLIVAVKERNVIDLFSRIIIVIKYTVNTTTVSRSTYCEEKGHFIFIFIIILLLVLHYGVLMPHILLWLLKSDF